MTDSPDFPADAEEPVGVALARWRRRKKIPGQTLGNTVGMSQAKISRLETGAVSPDPGDVRLLANALGLPPEEVERLVELADHTTNQLIDWRPTQLGLANRQRDVRQLEASTRELRIFQPAVVVGLLQTSEYARALMMSLQTELNDDRIANSTEVVADAVAARMQRNQILEQPGRSFHFVMAEAVLANQVGRPEEMLTQIARIQDVAERGNVQVHFVPLDGKWKIAPYHGFVVMDDRCVLVDLFNTSLMSRGRRTVRHYRRVFDALEESGTAEIHDILDKYRRIYARRLADAA
nr:helix-turn-helix transcriptional regulator [uncultured Actinoplanes sp.]